MDTNIYLHFDGNCEEAFQFYEKVLGAKILTIFRYEGSPMADQTPDDFKKKVMHARLAIGDKTIMGSDAPPGRYSKPGGFSINIDSKDVAEAERIFNAMAEGGQVHMPFAETFWAKRFGMLVDKFGVPWMVNVEKPM
jgi:PhnB protein